MNVVGLYLNGKPGSFAWLAQHELHLSWREWAWMISGGKRRRAWAISCVFAVFIAFLHLIAHFIVAPFAQVGIVLDYPTLITVGSSLMLSWLLMLSQAMELVTRAFYARADLDLILSSPVSATKVFAIRIVAIALSTSLTAALLAGCFINVLAIEDSPKWLAGYVVVLAAGLAATGLAVALTVGLFKLIGPRRTRLVAQVVAAIIGSAFVIGLQVAAVLSYGTLSRIDLLQSDLMQGLAPDADSLWWLPARATSGEWEPLIIVGTIGFVILLLAVLLFAPRFGQNAIAAAGVSQSIVRHRRKSAFRRVTARRALRRKEWTLLLRDPWLISQTLMQILYLLPPALLLWRSYGGNAGTLVVLTPVLAMSAGQLAGGLAWLAVSGEDAPDLLASAPVTAAQILRAKVEAVLGGIAIVFTPFVLALAWGSLFIAVMAALGIIAAAVSATRIQLWFRSQAKRSHFRRRQTSSRVATFAEAFSSISWASAAGLAAAGTWLAIAPGIAALCVLGGARAIRPRPA